MNIKEDKLKAAIQIALGMRGIYTEETESALVHHVKALSINVSGNATVDINTQVEILKKVINKLMITFDDKNDRMDYILDICNEYRKEAEKHYS